MLGHWWVTISVWGQFLWHCNTLLIGKANGTILTFNNGYRLGCLVLPLPPSAKNKQCKCIVDEVDDRGQRSGRIQDLTSWEASPIDKPIWLTSVFLAQVQGQSLRLRLFVPRLASELGFMSPPLPAAPLTETFSRAALRPVWRTLWKQKKECRAVSEFWNSSMSELEEISESFCSNRFDL